MHQQKNGMKENHKYIPNNQLAFGIMPGYTPPERRFFLSFDILALSAVPGKAADPSKIWLTSGMYTVLQACH